MVRDEHGAEPGVLDRPRVAGLLRAAARRRVTLVVAGGGFGKTTAVRHATAGRHGGWLALRRADRAVEVLAPRLAVALGVAAPPGLSAGGGALGAQDRRALAEGQAELLAEAVERVADRTLVVDEVEQLADDDPGTALLHALCLHAPPGLHVVLCGRRLPHLGLGRLRGQGEVAEVAAGELAFTVDETAALLAARLGPGATGMAAHLCGLTAGWAAALQLALARLDPLEPEHRPRALEQWERYRGASWRDFAADLLTGESASTRRLLAVSATVRRVDAGLVRGLGVEVGDDDVEELVDRGLLVPVGGAAASAVEGLAVSPVLASTVRAQLGPHETAALRHDAAAWLEARGRLEEALECSVGATPESTRALLSRSGYALVERGCGGRVAEVLAAVGTAAEPRLDGVLGAALQAAGDWDGALAVYTRLHRRTGGPGPPEVAWRHGALLHMRGDAAAALAVLSAAPPGALVSAWLSTTLWSSGDLDGAGAAAERAVAEAGDDPVARTAAHVAAALVAAGRGDRERNAAEYRLALTAGTEAGDSAQLARIHANLSSRAVEEGDYAGAVEHADQALRAGAGHRFFAALALSNKADALLCTGRLDEARVALDEAVGTYARLGSLREGVPRALLGALHVERGDLVRARVCLDQAVRLAERTGDVHARVTALTALVPILAAEDVGRARELAAEAVQASTSLELARALCAGAHVELHAGDRPAAAALARRAEAQARRTLDRAALAEALGLAGVAADPPDQRLLRDAVAVWDVVGNPLARCRTRLALALHRGDEEQVAALRRELAACGASPDVGLPALLATRAGERPAAVRITTLGRFRLLREGRPVTAPDWRSRKARDLLKILIAHHDRPVTRDAAADALWPGEAGARVANRLSVALSVLRRVLDPDRAHAADHYLATDLRSLALRTDRVEVDVVAFDHLAREGIALGMTGYPAEAEDLLRRAERLYAGDFLEEDRFEDWAVDRREAARATAQTVSRLLARLASDRGDEEAAGHHLWRLLERDPYDEDAWQAALGTQLRLGHPGRARRLYAGYVRRMDELGIAPLPLTQARDRRA
ncbi:winged helix-turn-helix domain-containing protein [Pseudonocardia sp. KRD-184]|uniref:Winged helix-turn-helix domain-containing protein n=1 Tax=Pseudonocardia oceani TaxID=2792013 RepID=A0ABS6U9Y0_9PSEU|nr:BTAD domain-containing putative transcriptional regulator [Pseudonocardia oceani]MBW0092569.1 winged helix-turn-helix domain-containing protein [Pseudonocardia oceani]MBW0099433.1 winged helix-turn-helix domain-containing protein [Pseudonocardia oceani]MBW0111995.1 winged helix-turn-helix domain-containing protein [Pseudonocardia oceani]MBW0124024.1 winged helix-turn-helix domain-containing protein [Pseudonocardia oceani]MBW0128684.1 winged helix-turn-helix domain-containing protein [Pseudo